MKLLLQLLLFFLTWFTSVDMLPNGDIKTNDNCYIRSKFSNPADEMLPMEARNRVFKPFEPILCVLYSKPSFGAFEDKIIGRPFLMPAITFKWMKQKVWTYAINASMGDVVKLAAQAAAVGSITAGTTGWRLYMDVGIVAKTFADDVVRIPQINSAIRALPGGDEFLWYYQKCSMIADIAYISPYALKFFKGFAMGAYNLSKRGYQTVSAFTEHGWTRLKDYYKKVKERLGRSGVVVEDLVDNASTYAVDVANFYTIDRAAQSKGLINQFNLMQYAGAATVDEAAAIHRYTVNNFELTNAVYNQGYSTVQQSWVNLINSGLDKLRLTKLVNTTVYRGSNMTQDMLDPFFNAWQSANKTISIPAFQSCSKLKEVAEDFIFRFKTPGRYEVFFEIESKSGVYIDELSDYGKYLQPTRNPSHMIQEEVLIKNSSSFKITAIEPQSVGGNIVRYKIKMQEL